MTPVQSPPAPPQSRQQQFLAGITARLEQCLKDPPDLSAYVRIHAECIANAFRPVGFCYEMLSGSTFQRVLHGNLETLDHRAAPEQENAFHRARSLAAEQRKPVVLGPNSTEGAGHREALPADAPAPEELPLFNRTKFEQVFIPIPAGEATAGVIHLWFEPVNAATSQTRVTFLRHLAVEFENYLKARKTKDAFQEVTRLTTYSKLLEQLTGDIDLDSVSWKLVNYAREAIACERVCLFVASNYNTVVRMPLADRSLEYDFRLQACSGLKKPHAKSEQAVILQHVAQTLTEMSLAKAATKTSPAPEAGANGVLAPLPGAEPKGAVAARPATPPAKPASQPAVQLTLIMRDPSKTATRPPAVNEYFDVMPMNWATVIPLFDREYQVCGILLFEGVKVEEKLGSSFKPMIELAASAGKSLGTTLYCTQHRPLRMARQFIAWHREYVNTPAKRKWVRFGIPALVVAALLLLPVPYSVNGNSNVLPVKQTTLPALVGTRLLEVDVREGESVKKGQVLARFETTDIQLQLSQSEQEYQRSLVESDAALNMNNEAQMQIARLNADKAAAASEKLRTDLQRAVVRAPFDGLVLGAQTLSTRVGEVLRLGEPALQVVDPTFWQVKASLKERDLILLGKRLTHEKQVTASLRLSANPGHKYPLALTTAQQLAYGLDTTTGEYQFTAMLPLNTQLADAPPFKAGFTGRVSFDTGTRPLAYVLFKDFVDYLTVRFF